MGTRGGTRVADGTARAPQRLLLVGPLPPPRTGTGVSFQIFCEELRRAAPGTSIGIIDTSPKQVRTGSRRLPGSAVGRAVRIVREFRHGVVGADKVLVFGSNGFLVSMLPLLLVMAKRARRPVSVRPFGGSLDQFCSRLNPVSRRLLLWTLRGADGVCVQTELLHKHFAPILGTRVRFVPNYRRLPPAGEEVAPRLAREGGPLQVVFLGLVMESKGAFVLLEALRRLARGRAAVHCDLYGEVAGLSASRFREELARTPRATYRGVLDPERVVPTLRQYDVLVSPTYYQGEGHPGVLIEAMMAGLPVVTTDFRSIPELVEHRRNGLLVAPRSVEDLVAALELLHDDRGLLAALARENWSRRLLYDARRVVPLLVERMGVELGSPGEASDPLPPAPR